MEATLVLGSGSALCPTETTLSVVASANGSVALLKTANCASLTTIDLVQVADKADAKTTSLVLNAQRMGVVHYIHQADSSATTVNLTGNPLASIDLSSASANLTRVVLSSCSLSSLSGVAFPQDETRTADLTLDLSKNVFASLVNISLPDSLTQLILADNVLERIEATELPSSLQLLDLRGNPLLQSVEIRAKDVPIWTQASILPTISLAKCADSRAELQQINSHRVCVISDALFQQKKFAESAVQSTDSSSSHSKVLSIVLGLLYAMIGLTALVVVAFFARKMVLRRRARRESDQINQYLDARGLTPPPESLLSWNSTSFGRTSSFHAILLRGTGALGQPISKLPRLQSQSPRGFLRPLLRVLSGARHEPAALPSKPPENTAVAEGCPIAAALDSSTRTALALEDFRIPEESVTIGKLVSRGAFTQVYLATIRESGSEEHRAATARLPALRYDPHQTQLFMDAISKKMLLKHPNIVAFRGFTHINQVPCALMEHMAAGDLESLLSTRPPCRQSFQWFQSGEFSPKSKAEIALDVVDALVYLHSLPNKFVVGNLRAKRVLLAQDFTAKLCAFGIEHDAQPGQFRADRSATILSSGVSSSTSASSSPTASLTPAPSGSSTENSVAWMAPELLRGQQHTNEKSDMYAFGVLLTELDTCELPYSLGIDDLDRDQVALLVSSGCIRPSLAMDCPVPIQELILKCLSFSPEDRPHGVEVQYALRKLVNRSTKRAASVSGEESPMPSAEVESPGDDADAGDKAEASADDVSDAEAREE